MSVTINEMAWDKKFLSWSYINFSGGNMPKLGKIYCGLSFPNLFHHMKQWEIVQLNNV